MRRIAVDASLSDYQGAFDQVIDWGSGLGRCAYEYASRFRVVYAQEHSRVFCDLMRRLFRGEAIDGILQVDARRNIHVVESDAVAFAGEAFMHSDLIFMGNLIDRVNDPSTMLRNIVRFIKPHGRLVITSPYTWMTEFTPKQHWIQWIGGYVDANGEMIDTLDGLKSILAPDFVLTRVDDIDMTIVESDTYAQCTSAQLTVWDKRR